MRGADNLQRYLSEAILPPVDNTAASHLTRYQIPKGARRLDVSAGKWRRLKVVRRLGRAAFDRKMRTFCEQIPSLSLDVPDYDPRSGEQLCVPASEAYDIRPPMLVLVKSSVAVEEIALQTASRALHMAFPSTSDWCFLELEDETRDSALMTTFRLTNPISADCRTSETKLIVFVIPPWTLKGEVLEQFIMADRVDIDALVDDRGFPLSPTFAQQLWFKVADVCARESTRYFVVTNYDQWTFGGFSAGWSAAFISFAKPKNATSPTIMQSLVTWMGSSLDLPKTFVLPSPLEDVTQYVPCAGPQGWNLPDEPPARDEDWDCGNSETSQPMYEEHPVALHFQDNNWKELPSARVDQPSRDRYIARWFAKQPENTGVVQYKTEELQWEQQSSSGSNSDSDSLASELEVDRDLDFRAIPLDQTYDVTLMHFPHGRGTSVASRSEISNDDAVSCAGSLRSYHSVWSAVGKAVGQPFGKTLAIIDENDGDLPEGGLHE